MLTEPIMEAVSQVRGVVGGADARVSEAVGRKRQEAIDLYGGHAHRIPPAALKVVSLLLPPRIDVVPSHEDRASDGRAAWSHHRAPRAAARPARGATATAAHLYLARSEPARAVAPAHGRGATHAAHRGAARLLRRRRPRPSRRSR